jgi:hypothetical protein
VVDVVPIEEDPHLVEGKDAAFYTLPKAKPSSEGNREAD